MQDELPDRHHNQPPEDMALPVLPGDASAEAVAEAQEKLAAPDHINNLAPYDAKEHAELMAHVDLFCDAAGKWLDLKSIQSEEQASRLRDFITGADQLFNRVENSRKKAKKPWDDLAAAVMDAYRPMTGAPTAKAPAGKLHSIRSKMAVMETDWLKREKARLAEEQKMAEAKARAQREAAEKAAREAESRNDIAGQHDAEQALKDAEKAEKQAAKTVAPKVASATGAGRGRGLRTTKHAKIINRRACFAYFQNQPEVDVLLERLATSAIRAGEITEDTANMVGVEIITKEG
ncbi:MAG: hypothetical protein JXQ79_03230 [Rhodobacteraceae bacterium]|nr:hypothetical protein [Paracoccaceae bacterium]